MNTQITNPYQTTVIPDETYQKKRSQWLTLPLSVLHDSIIASLSSGVLACISLTAIIFLMIRMPSIGSEDFYFTPVAFLFAGLVWGMLVGTAMGFLRGITLLIRPAIRRKTLQWMGLASGIPGALIGCLVPAYIILDIQETTTTWLTLLGEPLFYAICTQTLICLLLSALIGWLSGYSLHYLYYRNLNRNRARAHLHVPLN